MNEIYLASKSPRRKILLEQINVEFEIIDSEIDESLNKNEKPLHYVRRMSIEKARAGWLLNRRLLKQRSNQKLKDYPVLAADTSIAIDSRVLGKPENRHDAYQMLTELSGKTHQVITCVSVIYTQMNLRDRNITDRNNLNRAFIDGKYDVKIETIDSITNVSFMKLEKIDIERYLETDEWQGKAGSYAIQGYVAKYITSIEGSYSGVVGLPLYETSQLLKKISY
ncbi:MAG: septum formation protein Maf [Gammaproteobacteria bacterium]|nr:MAG: septum formation protein Maf [Gammaproteobacteria bacterium]